MWDSVNSSSGFTYSAIEFMVLWQTRNHRAIKKKMYFIPKQGPCISSSIHICSLLMLVLILISIASFSTYAFGSRFFIESTYWSEIFAIYKTNKNKAVCSITWTFFYVSFCHWTDFCLLLSYFLIRYSLRILCNRCRSYSL